MTDEFKPTAEQEACIEAFLSEKNQRINAYAGTGKTSTLKLLARANAKRMGTYVAFNKSIATEAAKEFPDTIACSTGHSLAFRATMKSKTNPKGYEFEKMTGNVNGGFLAKTLGLKSMELGEGQTRLILKPRGVGWAIAETIKRWQRSGQTQIDERYVPVEGKLEGLLPAALRDYKTEIANSARAVWERMIDPRSTIPLGHDGYLKVWALSRPIIEGDFVLLDEAQDTNGVMLQIMKDQTAQVICVGDKHQCQPSDTLVTRVVSPARGSTSAVTERVPISEIAKGDMVLSRSIDRAHIYGNGLPVEDVASRPFDGPLYRVTAGETTSRYTPEHKCIVRIAPAVEGKHTVYLMRRGKQWRVGMTTGKMDSQGGRFGFMVRAKHEAPDAFWILGIFDDPADARLEEALVAYRFGIPQALFEPPGGTFGTRAFIDAFWSKIGDLSSNARKCLAEYDLSIDHPLWDNNKPSLIKRRPTIVHACNLFTGMEMFVEGEGWTPIVVDTELYRGTVHSLKVAGTETYFGDGILTHNSIYEWRGAQNAMVKLPADIENRLSTSWRFGEAIAGHATDILSLLGEDLPLKGNPERDDFVGAVANPDCILCRTNTRLIDRLFEFVPAGKRVVVNGGIGELLNYVKAAEQLMAGRAVDFPLDFYGFKDWDDVKVTAEMEEGAQDLRRWVKLFEDYTPNQLRSVLEGLPKDEKKADIVLSTGHKSKGREWGSVRLENDFLMGVKSKAQIDAKSKEKNKTPSYPEPGSYAPELRLFYVAATRGKSRLDIPEDLQATVEQLIDEGFSTEHKSFGGR